MTEWVKASLSQAEFTSAQDEYDYASDSITAIKALTKYYLASPHRGQYTDSIDEDNQILVDKAPASTFHITFFCIYCTFSG
jgi:mannose/cellobiose epimerase-like protein (N-acyl-D-glucosamine 2-epimerase family)